MRYLFIGLVLTVLPLSSFASTCDQTWFHIAGVSKHIEIYQPTEYTRYKRQTHPGLGVECQNSHVTIAAGEFTNSLNRPFKYASVTRPFVTFYKMKLFAGVLAGEYGRTVREPLKLITPITYLEYKYKHAGLNFFALPAAKGVNDYMIFYTQFKIRF